MKPNPGDGEMQRKTGPADAAASPQWLSAGALSGSQLTGPHTAGMTVSHDRAYAQMTGARAYLDPGSKISGEVKFEGPAQIEGRVDGEIFAKAELVIGRNAVVTAQIRASSIIVAGRLKGDIIASERIEIGPSATVAGSLVTPKLVVHEDATFEGRCAMHSQRTHGERQLAESCKDERDAEQAAVRKES